MTTKLTAEEEKKFERVEQGSRGRLRGVAAQRYELNLLCWRLANEHQNDGCWACVYVEGQRA